MCRVVVVIAAGAVVAMLARAAVAHPGPRVWVNVEGQTVTTYQGAYPPGDPSAYTRARVFTQPLVEDEGVADTDFPGFQMVPGGTISAGTTFGYDITGALLFYEPGSASHAARFRTVARHFAAAPAVPQFAVTNELFQTKFTADGFVSGDPAFAYNGGAGDHNHLTYTLLGDGQTVAPGPDGVYALPLRLTASGLTPSETYFLLLGHNASAADLLAAAALAGKTLVLPGDANMDGVVEFDDYQRLERGFGNTEAEWSQGDFNGDGLVNKADLKLLLEHYGDRADAALLPPVAQAVPEPGAAAFGVLALSALQRRPRRH